MGGDTWTFILPRNSSKATRTHRGESLLRSQRGLSLPRITLFLLPGRAVPVSLPRVVRVRAAPIARPGGP